MVLLFNQNGLYSCTERLVNTTIKQHKTMKVAGMAYPIIMIIKFSIL